MQCALGTLVDTHVSTHTIQIYVLSQIRASTEVGPMLEFDQLSTIKGFT